MLHTLLFLTLFLSARPVAPGPGGQVFLPLVRSESACTPIPGESYGTLDPAPPPTDRPAEIHADLNLALRGYTPTIAYPGLVDYGGDADPAAPQLGGLFSDWRAPAFTGLYQISDWNWSCNCRAGPIANPDVTLATLAAQPGEVVSLPPSGYGIGQGYQALVLYAATDRLTLKYTREDNVVSGYTLHLERLCVSPDLLTLYRSANATGRSRLPALRAGQPLGRARGSLGVAIRDNGAFLDPRSRKDWWLAY